MYQKEGIHQRSKGGDSGKSKFSGQGGVLETSYVSTTFHEIEILLTLIYFHPLGCFQGGCLY